MAFSISRILLATTILMAAALHVGAKPAKRGLLDIVQPDGSAVTATLSGNAFSHQYRDPQGNILLPDSDGRLISSQEWALRHPSLEFFSDVNRPQGANPGLFDYSFPTLGDQKVLVVLVEYTDVKFKTEQPLDYFSRMLNEPGFADFGSTGSCADYFQHNSQGLFKLQFDCYGPVTLAHNQAYYGANDIWGWDVKADEMAIEACQLLDDDIDFSQYDRDADGFIDNIYIFYAGRGEADGGGANSVWPHAYNVTYTHQDEPFIFDGVQLDRYACSNEWMGSRPDGVGTFVHEFSHVLGLPDLYCTDETSNPLTPGPWDVMDYGSYNNDGLTPPNYSAFERYALGWFTPEPLGNGSLHLHPISSQSDAFILEAQDPDEFFIFEYRDQSGWDAFIPTHGMLVWHVDYNEEAWYNNIVNNNRLHQYVDLVEADNIRSEGTREGDCFPGSSNVSSFTPEGKPAFTWWNSSPTGAVIQDIAEADGRVFFSVTGLPNDSSTEIIVSGSPDSDFETYYYNLQGHRLPSPPKGFYIVKSGNRVSKKFNDQ